MSKRIAFICIGNMCRSQMAEGLARHLGGENLVVESAGTHPTGQVSPAAVTAMSELGIDISQQLSKGIPEIDLAAADVIVSMAPEPAHSLAPGGFEGSLLDWDVPDPIGYPVEIFRFVLQDILHRVEGLLAELGVEYVPLPAVGGSGEGDEEKNRPG